MLVQKFLTNQRCLAHVARKRVRRAHREQSFGPLYRSSWCRFWARHRDDVFDFPRYGTVLDLQDGHVKRVEVGDMFAALFTNQFRFHAKFLEKKIQHYHRDQDQ